MFTRTILPTVVCCLLLFSSALLASEKPAPEDPSELMVRLRLNAVETEINMGHYESLVKRELSLQGNVRACVKSGDPRLPEYQQALQEAQDDLEKTRKKLIALEADKAKLIERLGKKNVGEASPEPMDRANRTLEKILERLNSIDKRLEKIERQR